MRKVLDFVRQWGLWIIGLLLAATIVLNWETWLTANNFDQLWRTIPQSGSSAVFHRRAGIYLGAVLK